MKKNVFLATLFVAFSLTSSAQLRDLRHGGFSFMERAGMTSPKGDIQYRMTSCIASDGYENYTYTYDSDNRIVKIYSDLPYEYQAYDTIIYNEQGQLARLSEWQLLNGTWTHVNYIDYTYDNEGRIHTRTNYNFFGGVWELGGVYTYSYNSNGQITYSELVMANELYQTVEYQYQDGRILRELWSNKVFGGTGLELSEIRHYFYEAGKTIVTDTFVDYGYPSYGGRQVYVYDGVGNCTEYSVYDEMNGLLQRSEYEFESRLVANTVFPTTPEEGRPYVYDNYNTYTIEHLYMLDASFVLQHVCDYHYTYSDLNGVGITAADADPIRLYPNPASTHLTIEGPAALLEGALLKDSQGRTVAPVEGAGLNTARYAPGLYFLQLRNGQAKPVVIVR